MKFIRYSVIGIIVFLLANFISISFAQTIGAGPNEIGIVVSAIAVLCSVIVVCTTVIVEMIRDNSKKDK